MQMDKLMKLVEKVDILDKLINNVGEVIDKELPIELNNGFDYLGEIKPDDVLYEEAKSLLIKYNNGLLEKRLDAVIDLKNRVNTL